MAAGARQGCFGAFVLQSDVGFVQENLRVIEQVSPRPTCSLYSLGVHIRIRPDCLVHEGVASTSGDCEVGV